MSKIEVKGGTKKEGLTGQTQELANICDWYKLRFRDL